MCPICPFWSEHRFGPRCKSHPQYGTHNTIIGALDVIFETCMLSRFTSFKKLIDDKNSPYPLKYLWLGKPKNFCWTDYLMGITILKSDNWKRGWVERGQLTTSTRCPRTALHVMQRWWFEDEKSGKKGWVDRGLVTAGKMFHFIPMTIWWCYICNAMIWWFENGISRK